MTRFASRSGDIEIMDDLQCSGQVVTQTLRELDIINRLLGGNNVTLSGVQAILAQRSAPAELVIGDLGCGSGDMLKRIAEYGRKLGLKLRLVGIDANPNIIAFAVHNCRDYSEINFEVVNVFSEDFQNTQFDIVVATLFLHHFTNDELVQLLRSLARQTKIGIVINDIHRHWLAYHSIRLLTKFFSKSSMVKFDAPLSVRRAFRRNELEALLGKAEITNFVIRWKWAFRWQLLIRI
jgi:2-polyprenyl-3-methyl-5-hydroxy-6-metoxy-1,4-benzoquinol methylase